MRVRTAEILVRAAIDPKVSTKKTTSVSRVPWVSALRRHRAAVCAVYRKERSAVER